MKKKTTIAVITALMMLLTLIPGAAFAGTEKGRSGFEFPSSGTLKEKLKNEKRFIPQVQMAGMLDDDKQYFAEKFDEDYYYSVGKQSTYIPVIWKQINEVYDEGRKAIFQARDWWELLDAYFQYSFTLEVMSDMIKTEIKKDSDLSTLQKKYTKEINQAARWMSKSEYNAYYWDQITEAIAIGKKEIAAATTFKAAVWAYAEAMDGIYGAMDKEDMKYLRKDAVRAMKRYINLGLDKNDHLARWGDIMSIYDSAVSDIGKQQTEESVYMVFDNAADDLMAITDTLFITGYLDEPEGYYPFTVDLAMSMAAAFLDYDWHLYSDNGYDRLYYAGEKAFYRILDADTRPAAEKAYNAGISNMKKVLTKVKEIAALKASVPKGLKASSKKATSFKLSWKPVKYASGYYIYSSSKKNGKYKRVGYTYSKKPFTVKKLKKGKTYYFKLRAFSDEIDWDKTYYSKYSKPLKVKM